MDRMGRRRRRLRIAQDHAGIMTGLIEAVIALLAVFCAGWPPSPYISTTCPTR